MKKTLSIIISIILLMTNFSIFSYAQNDFRQVYTGLISDSYEEIMSILDTSEPSRTLPSRVDNTNDFPTPGNQGAQNSCVGWAVAYALKSNSEYSKRNWSLASTKHQFSPAYVYNQIVNGNDGGATISDAVRLLVNQGVCTVTYFPYNENDYTTQPSAVQSANANLYKASECHTIIGINTIKSKIAEGKGVVIGIKVYPDFRNISSSNMVYDNMSGTMSSNHAICLIGYDDNVGTDGAFKFINSWGTNWGLNGYGWISYDLVKSAAAVLPNIAVGYYIDFLTTDSYVMGDVDSDGYVSSSDARLVLMFTQNLETPTAEQFALSDVDGDGSVTTADSREILKFSAELIEKFSLYI